MSGTHTVRLARSTVGQKPCSSETGEEISDTVAALITTEETCSASKKHVFLKFLAQTIER